MHAQLPRDRVEPPLLDVVVAQNLCCKFAIDAHAIRPVSRNPPDGCGRRSSGVPTVRSARRRSSTELRRPQLPAQRRAVDHPGRRRWNPDASLPGAAAGSAVRGPRAGIDRRGLLDIGGPPLAATRNAPAASTPARSRSARGRSAGRSPSARGSGRTGTSGLSSLPASALRLPNRSAVDAARSQCNTLRRTRASGTQFGARRRNVLAKVGSPSRLRFFGAPIIPANPEIPVPDQRRHRHPAGRSQRVFVERPASSRHRGGALRAPETTKRKTRKPGSTLTSSGTPGQRLAQTPRQISAVPGSHLQRVVLLLRVDVERGPALT